MNQKFKKNDICKCKFKFDGRKCNSNGKWNNDKCRCKCKKHHLCKKDYIRNPATCSCKNGKYLASITDNSVIIFDEIIDANVETKSHIKEAKTIPKNICKTKCFNIFIDFLLIAIALLIAFSIYFCQIKYERKQKHLLPHYITDEKLINVL